ncbi:DUF1376 domain-containing protein [Rhodopseudomonas palustris]|uniref:DUF1376 domain-containing protein n=1 Tax=Rhodopseudomonas palustris TaxID=1076 RepID=A0AAX3DTK2_RHOPL|nr:DUF1376 domain-containing protein [Rhodopseudomonas palustris]UYO37485.1 DUF1376 domain-containing protein [Rhodopseudomonas palustris]
MTAEIIDHPSGQRRPDPERVASRFWMKHDVKAFAFETSTMDAEGAGALILLRGHYFITGGLPKTDAECAKVCRLSARKFARIRSWLFSFFDDEGRSEELDASICEAERISATRREAGRKGGVSKALAFARREPKQNPRQSQLQSQLQSQSEEQQPSESSSSSPPPPSEPRAREADEIANEVLGRLPLSARAHPGWRGFGAWIDRILSGGAHRVDVVAGVTQCLRSLEDKPPSSFGYFSAAIERAREARTRSLPSVGTRVMLAMPDPELLGPAGEILRKRIGDDVFASWFGKAHLTSIRGDTATVAVQNSFVQSRVIAEYERPLLEALSAADPAISRVVVVVGDNR